jgi:ubiquinone/menaquinone biosynthesis C-methylase UbiE
MSSPRSHKDVVRDSFTQQVGLFTGENSIFARRSASPTAWVEPLDRDMLVLDVACGAAHASEQVAPHVRQVVGIDLTPALLRAGYERLAGAGVDNVLLQEGDAADLPFVDASFDLVVCRSSLHHMPNPALAAAEMARVCRPDGRVVVSDMIVPGIDVRDAFDELHRTIDPSHVRALVEAELAELLRDQVGPLSYGETSSISVPIDVILTSAADTAAARAVLERELEGGPPTGFAPTRQDDQIVVTFSSTVVHASRGADANA